VADRGRSPPAALHLLRVLRRLARRVRLPDDPLARGLEGLWRTQARVVRARELVLRLLGRLVLAQVRTEGRVSTLKRARRARAELLFSSAPDDPELGTLSPARQKARIAVRLRADDERLGEAEELARAAKALARYAESVLEHATAAKEVLRQQVDLIREERARGTIRFSRLDGKAHRGDA